MNNSPGYEALGIAPGDSFNAVLDAFQARAEAILHGDFAATAPGDWRVACESLDWISKQPGVRQLMKDAQCVHCGAVHRMAATALNIDCANCRLPVFLKPAVCRPCGAVCGLAYWADLGDTLCPACSNTTLAAISYGEFTLKAVLSCDACGQLVKAGVPVDVSGKCCPQCGNGSFTYKGTFAES